ncbi:multiple epidermal growth factor-like domains protein 11 [Physella acuta]|uniref:multiple epidermal growth factor-like domains protein 11 n=1 Tax=Physella acuta TaxID=109671 RepID=UPI0027DE2012|nr:multiple epidermal growth factor-like domains protein 11 [Physella acuta]
MSITGGCLSGCLSGYYGQGCQMECPATKWGVDCLKTCSSFCRYPEVCSSTNGSCDDGCQAGYAGPTCIDDCDPTSFGQNCSQKCSTNCTNQKCNNVNGVCSSCVPGKQGDLCDQEKPETNNKI